jgi:hypothetical protein
MSHPSSIEEAILAAIEAQGEQKIANHAYFNFLKSKLYIPVEKNSLDQEPKVLFLEENDHIFLPVFSDPLYLQEWAGSELHLIDIFELSGIELLKGLGSHVTVAFNPGQTSYKEFNPEEIEKLKTMVVKIQQMLSE